MLRVVGIPTSTPTAGRHSCAQGLPLRTPPGRRSKRLPENSEPAGSLAAVHKGHRDQVVGISPAATGSGCHLNTFAGRYRRLGVSRLACGLTTPEVDLCGYVTYPTSQSLFLLIMPLATACLMPIGYSSVWGCGGLNICTAVCLTARSLRG